MQTNELKSYTAYNVWANKVLVGLIKPLSSEQLEQEIINSFPSIIKTAAHNWGAEYLWLKRLQGLSPTEFPGQNFKGTSHELLEELIATSIEFNDYVQEQKEESLFEILPSSTTSGQEYTQSRYKMIHHCMNHSSYHRGQITMMCRQLGMTKLKSMDYIWYLRNL